MNSIALRSVIPVCLLSLAPLILTAGPPESRTVLDGALQYQLVTTASWESDTMKVSLPDELPLAPEVPYFAEDAVRETAALANFVVGLKQASAAYFAELITFCEEEAASLEVECFEGYLPEGMSCEEYIAQEREYHRLRCLGNEEIESDHDAAAPVMVALRSFLETEAAVLGNDSLAREIELAGNIWTNMNEGGSAPPYNDEGLGGGGSNPWSSPGSGGGLGATPGGPQDFGYIRAVVDEGYIPLPFHLEVAGLFAEHDLPIASDVPCEQLLCVRSALGVAPVFGSEEMRTFVQVGFSSNLDPETFERRPLNLVAVVDTSGSMSDWIDEELSKMEAVKQALSLMVDQLGEDDRLAIVAFTNTERVVLESGPVSDRAAVKAVIAGLFEGGGTNIRAGLSRGFEIARDFSDPELRADRVMLFTDALPNVGFTGEESFLDLTRHYSELGIDLTSFGVGFNFGQELALALSEIRGGAYFFLEDFERMREIFGIDFDYLVTPLAYDLRLELEPGPHYHALEAHGMTLGAADFELEIPTLFLSRRHGAILLELERLATLPQDRAPSFLQ